MEREKERERRDERMRQTQRETDGDRRCTLISNVSYKKKIKVPLTLSSTPQGYLSEAKSLGYFVAFESASSLMSSLPTKEKQPAENTSHKKEV